MKIRNGFVSNSSSSSFLVVMAEDDYKKIADSLTPLEAAILEQVGTKKATFGSQNVVVHHHVNENCSTLECVDGNDVVERAREIAKERGVSFDDLYEDYAEDEVSDLIWELGFDSFEIKANELEVKNKAIVHSEYM